MSLIIDERGEWQQRIHAVLYHHGCPHHHGIGLLTGMGREWLQSLELPATAREQVAVALAMIGAPTFSSRRWTRSCAPTPGASQAARN